MDATPIPAATLPARARQSVRTVGFLAVLLAVAGGSFYAGRATTPDNTGKDEGACVSIKASAHTAFQDAENSHAASSNWWNGGGLDPAKVRFYANMVLQNPSCFTPEQRADAQTGLDQLNQARK